MVSIAFLCLLMQSRVHSPKFGYECHDRMDVAPVPDFVNGEHVRRLQMQLQVRHGS